ncbi:MAG: hypothetical protein CR991_01185 [Proteobacteria bacterium]|nr:MAG: hypothetical protein CR991_01185 [Pseudomonadota bacterium]
MKKILMTVGGTALLCGCTAVPIAVTPPTLTPLRPQPQALPMVKHTAYVHPAVATTQTPTAQPIPVPQPMVEIVRPPELQPNITHRPTPIIPRTQRQANLTHTIAASSKLNTSNNLSWIAQRIYRNQVNGGNQSLLSWNSQDNFVSLGIGRFVWYPAGKSGRFKETFPSFLAFAESQQARLPTWLAQRPTRGGPWPNKAAFERAQNDPQMKELENFMRQSASLQIHYLSAQLKRSLPHLTRQLDTAQKQKVMQSYQTLERTPGGLYPLLDYLLFQGDGSNPNERYNGQGWGLVQVLQNMEQVSPGSHALAEFMRAADDVLVQRIANAPPERREGRMLAAWQNRLQTYRPSNLSRR